MRDMKGDQRSSMKGLVFKVNTEGIATVCMYNAVGRGETTVLILSSRHLHHVPSDTVLILDRGLPVRIHCAQWPFCRVQNLISG